jgi:hypothetical protein
MLDELYMQDLANAMRMPEEVLPAGSVTVSAPEPEMAGMDKAFVGTRLNVPKPGQPTQQDREKMAVGLLDTLAGALRGAAAQTLGLPGDIRSILDMINQEGAEKYLGQRSFATTEEILKDTSVRVPGTQIDVPFPPVLKEGVPNREERQGAVEVAQEVGTFLPAPGVPEAVIQGGKLVGKAIKATKNMPIGMSIKMIDGTDAVVPKAPQINTPEFGNWFGGSKVVNDAGAPIAVFHGTGRPDRVGEQFRKSRATSGPMSFFTDNPEVASGYAKGKTDTSISYEDEAFDYKNWFKKKVGRSELNLEQAGARMSPQERNAVIEKLKDITVDEDTGKIIYKQGGGSIISDSSFDFYLKQESKGNPLVAANKIWLESGQLYGKEEEFANVLRLAGVKGFEYNDPHAKYPFVYKVFLSIKNPLDTANISQDIISALEDASKRARKPAQRGGADNWDKNTVAPKDWIERLKSDQAEGTSHAWTSIPDWVTKTLKAKGFDGIKDSGGKGGGTAHNVWIPFEENQVKSALGNKGTFSESKNIMRGVGIGGAGAAVTQEENK